MKAPRSPLAPDSLRIGAESAGETGPAVVVAIPTLMAGEALRECLESLTRQTFRNFEIVVVDNSGRGLVKQCRAAERVGVTVLAMSTNVGFGAAANRAWELFPSSHLATLNDDAVASPEWLSSLTAALERYPEAGMFASQVILTDSDMLDSAGMLLCADGSSKQRGHRGSPSCFVEPQAALLPSGAAALYRAQALREVGAFDPDFFLYCEDTDLGLRALRAGWLCRYVPEAKVWHRYSHSAGRVSPLKAYYVERNRLFLVVRNFPLPMLVAAPIVSVLRYAWHVIYLLRGRGAAAQFTQEGSAGWRLPWFVLRAHLALFRHLPRLLRQRRAIATGAKLSNFTYNRLLRRYAISARNVAQY